MINLLPTETKKELRAARMNAVLQRYLIFLTGSLLFMLAIFGVGYYITTAERRAAKNEVSDLEIASAKYSEVRKEAETFEKNLSIAKSILSNEVVFSDLVVDIAKTLPSGTVLTDLNLTTATFGESITINARTSTREGGLFLKNALQDSPYFDNVSIQTITNPGSQADGGAGANSIDNAYPYTVIMNATLLKEPKKAQQAGGTP